MLSDYTQKLYFNPFFGEANIEASGHMGIVKSGVNVAVWSAGVGLAAKAFGSERPVAWAVGTFAVLVVGEILFGLSGPSTNGSIFQINQAAPPTAAPAPPWAGTPGASVSFAETGGDRGFGEAGAGYN